MNLNWSRLQVSTREMCFAGFRPPSPLNSKEGFEILCLFLFLFNKFDGLLIPKLKNFTGKLISAGERNKV